MKKIFTIITAIVSVAVLFANPGEEATYESLYMSYNVERISGQVHVQVEIKNPEQYQEIFLQRSDDMSSSYRRIKYLDGQAVAELGETGLLIDKYPLSARDDVYYKIVTIDEYGVQKTYPAVVLSGK